MNDRTIDRRQFLKLTGLAALGAASACAASEPSSTPELLKIGKQITPPVQYTRSATQASQPTSEATQTTQPTSTDTQTSQPTSTPTQTIEPTSTSSPSAQVYRVLRIAHMTDFHVMPEGIARDGMVRALSHAQSQTDAPSIIFNTGDSILDSFEADRDRTEAQWEAFNSILNAECRLPIVHAIGNHDVWGWGRPDSRIKDDPLYGKAMAMEKLGLSSRYYSFELAGWHFIVLDSTYFVEAAQKNSYTGKIDDEQFDWLLVDLQAVASTTPICIISHIPILAACEYFDGPNEESGNWVVPGAWMHIDARRFRQLFLQYPNIRLCLSGHTHQHESLDYLGVRYLTNGAVCGNWWKGAYMDFPPAYVLVDLFNDGSAESQFVPYD